MKEAKGGEGGVSRKAPENQRSDQEKMRSGAVGRMAALGAAGARVGINYLKHYQRL